MSLVWTDTEKIKIRGSLVSMSIGREMSSPIVIAILIFLSKIKLILTSVG